MKVIITGATGYVGSTALSLCIADPSISKIFVLSRRPLEGDYDAKVEVIVHEDWLHYSPELMKRIEGATGCLWCIGGRHTQTSRWPTLEEYHTVTIDYPLAAARAFASHLAPSLPSDLPSNQPEKFRFVFCSGHATELDQTKSLWVMGPTRKAKGRAEQGLFDLADECEGGMFESYTVRPCGIRPRQHTVKTWLLTTFVLPTLLVEECAAAMVGVCKSGHGGRIVMHEEAKSMGGRILKGEGAVGK